MGLDAFYTGFVVVMHDMQDVQNRNPIWSRATNVECGREFSGRERNEGRTTVTEQPSARRPTQSPPAADRICKAP